MRQTFEAPRERVWAALTDPAQVDQRRGPDGFTTATEGMDVQPGGIWHFVIVRPDSEEYPGLIACDTVEEPERLTFTHGSPNEPEQFEVTVTFKDVGNGRTALTRQSTFRSAEERGAAEKFGALEATQPTLGHLAEHLANDEVA